MVPQSLLAFVYHITQVSPYRDEMHHDMRQALRRFGVNLEMMQRVSATPKELLATVRRASFEVERASYENRAEQAPLRVPMAMATQNLFGAIVPFLAWELSHGISDPEQAEDLEQPSLLRSVYFLFYSAAFRAKHPHPPELGTPVPVNAAQLATAWQVVRDALNAPVARRTVGDRENAALSTLMSALAVEFAIIVWPFCW